MTSAKSIPVWQRLNASGTVRQQVAGVSARLKDGDSATAPSATWHVNAESLAPLAPKAGDRCVGTDGVRRTCSAVGALANGEYEVTLAREGGGA